MRILMIGDVVSDVGCELVRRVLPGFKKQTGADFCVVNGENSAKGNGITPASYEHLLASGADAVTGGNHTLRRPEFYRVLDDPFSVALRPVNLHRAAPGRGAAVIEKRGLRLGAISLMGQIYMDYAENPFDAADKAVGELHAQGIKTILVDFHAEATSEKKAMGYYLDGRVSAVLGTHTHVQTADEQILPGGTAYITDAGMTGAAGSVLGVTVESATKRMRTGLPVRFEQAEGPCSMGCVCVTVDLKTGRATEIERLFLS
jgi:metallophosphoesterase (TIGR00282 family)